MNELERDLEALASRLDYPVEDVRIPVRAGIIVARRRRRRLEQVIVASALLIAAFGPAFIAGSSRATILRFFGGGATSSTEASRETPTAPASFPGAPATLDTAKRKLAFRVLLPHGLRPDGVYLGSGVTGESVTVIFHAQGLRLRLTEFRGHDVSAPRGVAVEVDRTRGIWLAPVGRFNFTDATGTRRDVVPAAVGNALVWQRGPLTLQLQAVGLTRPTALTLARTVV